MALTKINNNTLSAVSELPSGISGQNYPAFKVSLDTDQQISDSVTTTIIETYEDGSYLVPCSLMC